MVAFKDSLKAKFKTLMNPSKRGSMTKIKKFKSFLPRRLSMKSKKRYLLIPFTRYKLRTKSSRSDWSSKLNSIRKCSLKWQRKLMNFPLKVIGLRAKKRMVKVMTFE